MVTPLTPGLSPLYTGSRVSRSPVSPKVTPDTLCGIRGMSKTPF